MILAGLSSGRGGVAQTELADTLSAERPRGSARPEAVPIQAERLLGPGISGFVRRAVR